MERNYSTKDAAAELRRRGFSDQTAKSLANRRGKGWPHTPRFFKLGTGRSSPVYYPESALNEWIEYHQARLVNSTSENRGAP